MYKMIQFELKKIIKSTLFKFLLVALTIAIFVFYGIVYMSTERIDDLIISDENLIANNENNIEEFKELIDSGNLDADETRESKQMIKDFELRIEKAKKRIEAYKEGDFAQVLVDQIDEEFAWFEQFKNLVPPDDSQLGRTPFTMESNIEQNKLIRERNITPVFPIDYSLTIYDEFETPEDKEVKTNLAKRSSSSGYYFLYSFVSLFFSIIGIGYFLFLFGDILTKESNNNMGPINYLYTQPISRRTILLSKFIAIVKLTICIVSGIGIISLILGMIFDSLGHSNYPILIYGEEFTFTFMNISTYLFKASLLFFMLLMFSYALLFLFSFLMRNMIAAMGATLMVIIIGIEISSQSFAAKIVEYMPFSYFKVDQVITNELAVTYENFKINYTHGLVTLIVFTGLLCIFSYILFVWKDRRRN